MLGYLPMMEAAAPRSGPRPWRGEARALIALALPLIAGNLAWSVIAAIDLLLLGRLGPDAVAAGALALNLYTALLVFGMGLVTAASPLVASERGQRKHSVRDIRHTVRQTLWAAMILCVPSWLILWHGEAILLALGQEPRLSHDALQLMRGLQWAMLPYLCFLTLRNFIASLERPLWAVGVLLLGIPVNFLAGWALIFGHLGLPALGLFGAGLASTVSATVMLVAMVMVILRDREFRRYHLLGRFWEANGARFRDVWRIGLPIAITLGLEVTVFNAAVFLMGLIDRASLAAHAIAIQIATLSFMVPMGIGQAATVRVGLAFGARDEAGIGRAGWLALLIGTGYACCAAAILFAIPHRLIAIFIDITDPANAEIVRLGSLFLRVAALFQLADGAQAIGAGALRGMHDTRVPMLFAAVGYWVIGIGIGTMLAFPLQMRGVGIWIGLASGLGVVAVLILTRWTKRGRFVPFPPPQARPSTQ
jgi:MATE family multidrug resistance protein